MPSLWSSWKLYLFALGGFLLVSINSCTNSPQFTDLPSKEEHEVYFAIIDSFYLKPNIDLIVIRDSTLTANSVDTTIKVLNKDGSRQDPADKFEFFKKRYFSDLDWETMRRNFNGANLKCYPLSPDSMRFAQRTILVGPKELKSISEARPRDYWSRFYEKYPKSDGLILFSRVGFNGLHNEAIVYIEQYHGGLSAWGAFIVLMKRDQQWIPQRPWLEDWTS